MSKSLGSNANFELAAENMRFVLLCYLDLDSELYITNAPFTITWDGHEWLGVGTFGNVSQVTEGAMLQMYSLTFTLSGIPLEYIQQSLGTYYQGRSAKLWVALLDNNFQIIDSPLLVFHGRMDTMDIELGETATISVNAESRLTDWNRPRISRYTHEDQQMRYPDDNGLEFVAVAAEQEILWGRL